MILNCFETGLGDHNVFKKFPIYLHITNTVVSIQILLHMRFIHVYVLNIFLQFLITMPQPLKEKLTPINSILCPGLGTAVGCMPYDKAAILVSQGYFRTLSG